MSSIRILGGQAQGLPLVVFGEARPSSVRLRRRLFDRIQNWDTLVAADLCAGVGSVGFEMASRGASVYLVEKHAQSIKALEKNELNLKKRMPKAQTHIVKSDVCRWLKTRSLEEFDLVFVDPPYVDHKLYLEIIDLILSSPFNGELWIESDRQKGLDLDSLAVRWGAPPKKVFTQGTSFLALFNREG